MPSHPSNDDRVLAICALVEAMTSFAAPPAPPLPSPPSLTGNPAQLAIDSAKSATAIAHAAAQLGHGDDQREATILWNETLNQIQRIQTLYNLPPFPFQSQTRPPGYT